MKKYVTKIIMLIGLIGLFPSSFTYAKETNIHLSNIELVTSVLNNTTNLEEKMRYIRNSDLNR